MDLYINSYHFRIHASKTWKNFGYFVSSVKFKLNYNSSMLLRNLKLTWRTYEYFVMRIHLSENIFFRSGSQISRKELRWKEKSHISESAWPCIEISCEIFFFFWSCVYVMHKRDNLSEHWIASEEIQGYFRSKLNGKK